MNTRNKRRKTQVAKNAERAHLSSAERHSRKTLAFKGVIDDVNDDTGFFYWLKSMSLHKGKTNDCRAPHEKRWQERLGAELGLV